MSILRIVLSVLLVLVILVLASLVHRARRSRDRPPLEPPAAEERLRPCRSASRCVSSDDPGDASIAPLRAEGLDALATLDALEGILRTLPEATVERREGPWLHATFRSRLFGFVDDVELLARPADGVVAVRSASREGRSDLGANRRRVERLRGLLAKERPTD